MDNLITKTNKYGWVKDRPDERDHLYTLPQMVGEHFVAMPTKVDLRPLCPPVYDQGALGSCTGNAIAGAIQFDRMKAGETPPFEPSRLFIYYNERLMEGTVNEDGGASIRDGIKSIAQYGVCPETVWPYDPTQFKCAPSKEAFEAALLHKAISYDRLTNDLSVIKHCLMSGYPFVMGITLFSSFESEEVAQTGIVPMPMMPYEQMIGGHAVMCVGYDDATQHVIVRNSWGPNWGQAGYFLLPYDYIANPELAVDLWTVRAISE